MFSKQQIRGQLFTFLFAGFETTSTAIESLLFHLGDEPEWTSKIAEEFEVCYWPNWAIQKFLLKFILKPNIFVLKFLKISLGSLSCYQSNYTEENAHHNGIYQGNCSISHNSWGHYSQESRSRY